MLYVLRKICDQTNQKNEQTNVQTNGEKKNIKYIAIAIAMNKTAK